MHAAFVPLILLYNNTDKISSVSIYLMIKIYDNQKFFIKQKLIYFSSKMIIGKPSSVKEEMKIYVCWTD